MPEFHFQQPYWFFGLIFIALWFVVSRHKSIRLPELFQPAQIRYPALRLLDNNSISSDINLSGSTSIFAVVFILLCIISLAQPAKYGPPLPAVDSPDPVDLIVVVNTGISMALRDYVIDGEQINRMQMSQKLLQKLVNDFEGRKIGLVILGRPPSLWLPLTSDRKVLSDAISRLKITLGGRNSDLGETLMLVKNEFTSSNKNAALTPAKHVLLLSDGYSILGSTSPEVAIRELNSAGFSLHTLAVGTAQRPEFSLGKGHLIYQPVDLTMLQNLAEQGRGKSLHARDLSSIDSFLMNLKVSEPGKKQVPQARVIIPLYQYPLTLALILLLYQLLPVSVGSLIHRWAGG